MGQQESGISLTDDASDILTRYLNYLSGEKQVSPHTVAAYRRDLMALAGFVSAHRLSR